MREMGKGKEGKIRQRGWKRREDCKVREGKGNGRKGNDGIVGWEKGGEKEDGKRGKPEKLKNCTF